MEPLRIFHWSGQNALRTKNRVASRESGRNKCVCLGMPVPLRAHIRRPRSEETESQVWIQGKERNSRQSQLDMRECWALRLPSNGKCMYKFRVCIQTCWAGIAARTNLAPTRRRFAIAARDCITCASLAVSSRRNEIAGWTSMEFGFSATTPSPGRRVHRQPSC